MLSKSIGVTSAKRAAHYFDRAKRPRESLEELDVDITRQVSEASISSIVVLAGGGVTPLGLAP